MKKSFLLYSASCICAVFILVFALYFFHFAKTKVSPDRPVLIDIESGMSAKTIAVTLKEKKVITNASAFLVLAWMKGEVRKLQAGTYEFEGQHTPEEVMGILFIGKADEDKVTIPEGWTVYDIAEKLEAHSKGLIKKERFLADAKSHETLEILKLNDEGIGSMEGFLFPDTYYLSGIMKPREIISRFYGTFKRRFSPEMEQRARQIGMGKKDLITLASIIEKEAVVKREKPVIASVFYNRLRKGMRLQSDPTAIYDYFRGKNIDDGRDILPHDLLRRSAYNTYLNRGLPPGPICNPGLQSIKAALWPADTNYLYFVSMGDGTHRFSESFDRHENAIKKSNFLEERRLSESTGKKKKSK